MKWASTFKYITIPYGIALANIKDQTQRVTFDNNLRGNKVRVLLSNRHSTSKLNIERMTIGIVQGDTIVNTTPITLHGSSEISLSPDQEIYSDEIMITVKPGDRLSISSYIADSQPIESVCGFWNYDGAVVSCNSRGDATDGTMYESLPAQEIYSVLKEDPSPLKAMFFYGFSALQVYTDDEVKVIAAFGDSITHMSFITNPLYKRLHREFPGKVSLINCGIGGNRMVHDATYIKEAPGEGKLFGEAGIHRFERDVFGIDHIDAVLVLMGINDIMHPIQFEQAKENTSLQDMQEGYRSLACQAHQHGAAIFGATITPCVNHNYPKSWSLIFEKARQNVNTWLRTEHPFDDIFDYDAVVRDDKHPEHMKEIYHIGDGLHPNTAGGRAIADAIDLYRLTGFINIKN